MFKVMCRLPEVVHLITVLNGCKPCCKAIRNQAEVERDVQREVERGWWRARVSCQLICQCFDIVSLNTVLLFEEYGQDPQ